jgi:hypothetical protein
MCSPFLLYFTCYCFFGKQSKRGKSPRKLAAILILRSGFLSPDKNLIPAFLLAEFRNVRGVMPAMPRIKKQQPVDRF